MILVICVSVIDLCGWLMERRDNSETSKDEPKTSENTRRRADDDEEKTQETEPESCRVRLKLFSGSEDDHRNQVGYASAEEKKYVVDLTQKGGLQVVSMPSRENGLEEVEIRSNWNTGPNLQGLADYFVGPASLT